jgi:TM2 domain-containing membrane protein YozV
VAALLNWIWSGAGNIYLGQKTKGFVFCGITLFFVVFDIITCSLGVFLHLPYMIVMIIDAALLAGRINKGESIGEWQFF